MVGGTIEITPIETMFSEALRDSFKDLAIPDTGATGYLTDLLVRFAATSEMRPAGATGERLESIADRVAEIQRSWAIDAGHFDPAREIEIRRGLADYALFVSGFFWESVRERSVARHYMREGKRAYRFVAEYHRALGQPEARLYQTLAIRFETFAAVVSYMRDIHLDGGFAPWPHPMFAKISY